MFRLKCVNREGEQKVFTYNQHTSELLDEAGNSVLPKNDKTWGKPLHYISPEDPGKKIRSVHTLKISLGLACNYSCSYCSQAFQVAHASKSTTADVDIFLRNLDTWLEGKPKRIELWGGEPLLYWNKIEKLMPVLKERYPDASYLIITNGTMLTEAIIDKMDEWDMEVAISHDGPGMAARGPDPLLDDNNLEMWRNLHERLGKKGKFGFNAVLTPISYDVNAIIDWFEERFGPEVNVGIEGLVHDYGGENSKFSAAQLRDFTEKLTLAIMDKSALRSASIRRRIESFTNTVINGRPSDVIGQKCGMDREDRLTVDLLGNVLTCQNTGSEGDFKIGHVRSFDKIKLNTSWHWKHRSECPTCPVLQLCAGSCMFLEGTEWEASCNAEFAYGMAVMAGTIFLLTGYIMTEIEGHMIRPGNNNG